MKPWRASWARIGSTRSISPRRFASSSTPGKSSTATPSAAACARPAISSISTSAPRRSRASAIVLASPAPSSAKRHVESGVGAARIQPSRSAASSSRAPKRLPPAETSSSTARVISSVPQSRRSSSNSPAAARPISGLASAMTVISPTMGSIFADRAAERHVQRDQVRGFGAPDLEQRLLRVEQITLGVEHFEKAHDARLVAAPRELGEPPLRLGGALLSRDLLGEIAPSREAVRDLAERRLDRELVLGDGHALPRLRDRHVGAAAAEIEQRHGQRRAERPRVSVLAEHAVELG